PSRYLARNSSDNSAKRIARHSSSSTVDGNITALFSRVRESIRGVRLLGAGDSHRPTQALECANVANTGRLRGDSEHACRFGVRQFLEVPERDHGLVGLREAEQCLLQLVEGFSTDRFLTRAGRPGQKLQAGFARVGL